MIAEMPSPYVEKLDPWSSHTIVLKHLARLPQGSNILDVGTASGMVGRACAGNGFSLYGLEPNPVCARQARPYYDKFSNTSLENANDAFLSGHDVVVCADVLEHLVDPTFALLRLVSLQPFGARFLISVPNIANLWVRLNLLFGRFEYTERGILDRTHLRFFTRHSFLKLIKTANLEIMNFQVTPIPLNLVSPFYENTTAGRLLHRGLAILSNTFPTLLGYQFVVEAIKR
jgi:2-polyprenyl-3-methyl-5-hydroxy-6-metoxy-1,4-benzoquinol methylase